MMTTTKEAMSTSRLPTAAEDLAPLLAAQPVEVAAQLRVQEGAHRAARLLRAAKRIVDAPLKAQAVAAEKAARKAMTPAKPSGRARIGEPVAHGRARDGSVRSRGTTIALGEGVLERVDEVAEKLTKRDGVVWSRNEVVRASIRYILAHPPEAEDVSFDSLRGHTGTRFVYVPEAGQDAALDAMIGEIAKEVGRGHLERQRIHLIRHAVSVFLGKHRRF